MKKDTIDDIQMQVQHGGYIDEVKQKQSNRIIYIIKNFENPYPRDIFSWENNEPLKIQRGRFNHFIHDIVENVKSSIIKKLEEEYEES